MKDAESLVIKCYQKCLNRRPDAAGLRIYVDFLNQDNDPLELERILMSSDEYKALQTQPSHYFYINTEDNILSSPNYSYVLFKNTSCKSLLSFISSCWATLPDKLIFTHDNTIRYMNKLLHSGDSVFLCDGEICNQMPLVSVNIKKICALRGVETSDIEQRKVTSFCISKKLIRDVSKSKIDSYLEFANSMSFFPEYTLPYCWEIMFTSQRKVADIALIVSRYNEDVTWCNNDRLMPFKKIIYNKGKHDLDLGKIKPIPIDNVGREGETYLNHIINNWDQLDEYTVFTQGDPFEHCPKFEEIVYKHYHKFKECQPLTYCWKEFDVQCSWFLTTNPTGIPPQEIRDLTKQHWLDEDCKIHVEYLNRNFECIYPLKWLDGGFNNDLIPRLRQRNNIDSSILEWVYERLGLSRNDIPKSFPFAFSAIFGVSKQRIRERNKEFYVKLREFLLEHPDHGYILERLWLHIFNF